MSNLPLILFRVFFTWETGKGTQWVPIFSIKNLLKKALSEGKGTELRRTCLAQVKGATMGGERIAIILQLCYGIGWKDYNETIRTPYKFRFPEISMGCWKLSMQWAVWALTAMNMMVRKGSKNGWYLALVLREGKKKKRKVMAVIKTGPLQINASSSCLGRDLIGLEFQLKG